MTAQIVKAGTQVIELENEKPDMASPARRLDVEDELTNRYHVDWQFATGVKASAFDFEKSQHNQARFQPIDQATVDIYTEAMGRGDVFPAVLAYRPQPRARYVMIDGNHRLGAHIATDTPVAMYEIARETHPRTIALLTFAMNTRHGKPTTEEERIHQGIYLVDNGASAGAAAAAVNLPVRMLRKAISHGKADRRADEVGLRRNEWDALSVAIKTRLVNISTDEGFRAAANLAYTAGLDTPEVFALVVQLNDSKSGTRQEAVVKAHKDMLKERIQGVGGGVLVTANQRHLNPKQRATMAVAQALALPESLSIVTAFAQAERGPAAEKMRLAGKRFYELADLLAPLKK